MSQRTYLSLKIKIKQINEESIIYCTIVLNVIGFKSVELIQTELWKFQRSRISNCKPTTLPNEIKWLDYILTHVIMHLTKNL